MTKIETAKLLKEIKILFPDFIVEENVIRAWARNLKTVFLSDLNECLDKYAKKYNRTPRLADLLGIWRADRYENCIHVGAMCRKDRKEDDAKRKMA